MSKTAKAINLGKQFAAYIAKEAPPRIETFLYYAKVELVPPKPNEIVAIKNGIQNLLVGLKTQRWKQTTVKEAWLNTLVGTEVLLWFFIGECIGKRSIVGYQI